MTASGKALRNPRPNVCTDRESASIHHRLTRARKYRALRTQEIGGCGTQQHTHFNWGREDPA